MRSPRSTGGLDPATVAKRLGHNPRPETETTARLLRDSRRLHRMRAAVAELLSQSGHQARWADHGFGYSALRCAHRHCEAIWTMDNLNGELSPIFGASIGTCPHSGRMRF